jgi:hypothetical protein
MSIYSIPTGSFWANFGNDIPIYIVGLLPVFITWYWHNKCHVHHCPWLGRFPFKHYKLCKKHHPKVPSEINRLHIMKLLKHDNMEK